MDTDEESRNDLISTVDNFIEKIQRLRKIMLGVSFSAIVLAPLAIGLSIYLLNHPSFFAILEQKDDFGVFLSFLLVAILIISGIWLYTGIRQYLSLNNWNHRYSSYLKKKNDLDSQISSQFHLDE